MLERMIASFDLAYTAHFCTLASLSEFALDTSTVRITSRASEEGEELDSQATNECQTQI